MNNIHNELYGLCPPFLQKKAVGWYSNLQVAHLCFSRKWFTDLDEEGRNMFYYTMQPIDGFMNEARAMVYLNKWRTNLYDLP